MPSAGAGEGVRVGKSMKVDPSVERLLIRAGILSKYHQRTWFAGCQLKGNVLTVTDALQAKIISLAYLPDLRVVVRDLKVWVGPVTGQVTAYRGASREPAQPRLED